MKLVLLLAICACAFAGAPPSKVNVVDSEVITYEDVAAAGESPEKNSILINALVRQLINYIRRLINNGSETFGFGPLDPLIIEKFHLNIPAGLINFEMDLEDGLAAGFGGFVVHRSNLNIRALTFDLDISVPRIDINAKYSLTGDLLTAFPIYGKGDATFSIENFRFRGLLHLKQSDDGTSILIDRIEGASFDLPHFECNLSGVIGGGDIDKIANAFVEDVLVGYINRFNGAISLLGSEAVIRIGNPILNQLETWRYIAPFV